MVITPFNVTKFNRAAVDPVLSGEYTATTQGPGHHHKSTGRAKYSGMLT